MADYKTLMEQTIEPFLQKYRKEFWMEREDEKKIYCLRFRVKNPKAVVVISHGFTENEEKYKESIYRFLKRNYGTIKDEYNYQHKIFGKCPSFNNVCPVYLLLYKRERSNRRTYLRRRKDTDEY